MSSTTPVKPVKRGPKPKELGPSDFCRICACSFAIRLGNFGKTSYILKENIFIEPVRNEIRRRRLADVLQDLGFAVKDNRVSSRVCSLCATKVRNTCQGFLQIKANLGNVNVADTIEVSSEHGARFKRMSTRHTAQQRGKTPASIRHENRQKKLRGNEFRGDQPTSVERADKWKLTRYCKAPILRRTLCNRKKARWRWLFSKRGKSSPSNLHKMPLPAAWSRTLPQTTGNQ